MKRANLIVLAIFLGALVWVFTLPPAKVGDMRAKFLAMFSPVSKAASALEPDAEDERDKGKSRADLLRELRDLRDENHRLKIRQALSEGLQAQVDQLSAALGFKQQSPHQLIPASVTRRVRTSWWSVITINRGSEDGIGKNMPVIVESGLVGRTTTSGLTAHSAEVLLLTDEQCVVSVRVGEQGDLLGIVRGQRGVSTIRPELRLVNVDKGRNIPAGARLYTTGEGSVYPPSLYVGRVLREVPDEMQKSATVEPGADMNALSTVFVMVPPPPPSEPPS